MATLKTQPLSGGTNANTGGTPPPVTATQIANAPIDSSTGAPQLPASAPTPKATPKVVQKPTTPIVSTTQIRAKAQENADLVAQKLNSKKVVATDNTSGKVTQTFADGTTSTSNEFGISSTQNTPDRTKILEEQKNIYSEQEQLQQDVSKKYDELKVQGDSAYNQLVDNIKTQFSITRTNLTDSNRRYEAKTRQGQYLNNGFRYTPQQSEGMVYDVEQYGIQKLGELNLQESQALQEALTAKNNNDYRALAQSTDAIRGIQSDRMNTLQAMNTQIKNIEETDKSIRNMNTNEASIMQSMINAYTLTSREMPAKDTDKFYEKKAKELSDLMGFKVAKEFVKAQVEGGKAQAAITYSPELSKKNGYYSDEFGRPMFNAEGKTIPLEKEDWGTWKEGSTLNVGTYDENGNKIIRAYELSGAEPESYADTIKNMPQTQTNVTVVGLSQAYKGPMSELILTKDGTFVKTTNPAYKNIGNGGMQCAEFVNRVTGTSFASGKAAAKQDPKTLQVGSVASWMPAGAGEYGHAGIIVGEEGDNWIIKSANLRGNGIISTDSVPKSVIKGGYTPDSVKNLSSDVSGIYDPLQDDKNLTPIGQNKDGSGIYLDKNTNQTISEAEAKALYGKNAGGSSSQFTSDQIAVMQTITGKPTAGDKATLAKYGLDEAKLGTYRQEKASQSSAYDNLDNSTKTRVDKYVLDFENEQVVKDFNTMNVAIQTARTLADSDTDDQALIYTFAKVMDPNSVVRESEYQTVQDYSQSLVQRFGGKIDRVFGNDGFMTDDAKRVILSTLEKKLNAQKISYDNIRNQTKKQIRGKASSLSDAEIDDMLKQYDTTSQTYQSTTSPTMQNSQGQALVDFSSI